MADARAKRREERVKLFATFLSNGGLATIIASFVSPLFAGRAQPILAAAGTSAGLALHLVAQALLHYVVRDSGAEDS